MLYRRERLGEAYWLISKKRFQKWCAAAHQYIDKVVQEALLAQSTDNTDFQDNESPQNRKTLRKTQNLKTTRLRMYIAFWMLLSKRHVIPESCETN